MSTFWTPDGERPVRPEAAAEPAPAEREPAGFDSPIDLNEDEAALAQLREQLLEAPVEVVVANHAFGLFELAALHLSAQPANVREAQLAIDALGAMVESLEGRLGEAEAQLQQALSQLRMAFVQIQQAAEATGPSQN